MAHFHSTTVRPRQGYPSVDFSSYQYGESSTSALRRNRETLTKLQPPSDLPELYFDYEEPSPPSATASNLITTPPLQEGWPTAAATAAPWQGDSSPDVHSVHYASFISPSNWDASMLPLGQAPPAVAAPLDPSFPWMYHTQTLTSPEKAAAVSDSIIHPSTSYDDYDQLMSVGALDAPFYAGTPAYPAQAGIPPHSSASNTTHSMNFSFGPSLAAPSTSVPFGAPAPAAQSSSKSSSSITHTSTTISPSAPYPSPPPTATPPLKIHQPRPSRRIPIISLSHLASTCDTYPIYPPPQEPTGGISAEVKPAVATLGRSRRQDTKPYLPITSHRANAQFKSSRQQSQSSHRVYHPHFSVGTNTGPGQVAQCPCGCMQSFICH
ncbi:hypothetical protein D9619_002723 [Psilocybe cf. subviscida]|uniref:Uncharacterized protein n=1 Tax=Psilocybe cf. subviscida TaxID=2480587 RepID=A0A8H5AWA6_9AGAR|nr:hypothetical protein D9619_002723 [Psilocybe cf. subviscida]